MTGKLPGLVKEELRNLKSLFNEISGSEILEAADKRPARKFSPGDKAMARNKNFTTKTLLSHHRCEKQSGP